MVRSRTLLATDMSYATSEYLVYTCFETKGSVSESIVGGCLLLDRADTEQEAAEKVALYKARGDEFNAKFPSPDARRYIFIKNQREWWTRA
jgi:hypothetical protein